MYFSAYLVPNLPHLAAFKRVLLLCGSLGVVLFFVVIFGACQGYFFTHVRSKALYKLISGE